MSGWPDFPCIHIRDSVYSGLLLGDNRLLRSAISYAAATQGKTFNFLNGEEPGKVMHEDSGDDPSGVSNRFAACDTTALFLIGLGHLFIGGDTAGLLEHLQVAVVRAAAYLLAHVDGPVYAAVREKGMKDLFLDGPAYRHSGSSYGLPVSYWKDSRIPGRSGDERGGIPEYPVVYALAHVQAMAGLVRAATLLEDLGVRDLAAAGRDVADRMRKSLSETLWDDAAGIFVTGRDACGAFGGISSDIVHALYFLEPGWVPTGRVVQAISSCIALETPVGFRTLDPALAYGRSQPLSPYHSKTLWPFEQAVIHAGATRHLRWARDNGETELASSLEWVREVSRRVVARLDRDPESDPEACLLLEPVIHSSADPNVVAHGCMQQLWTIAPAATSAIHGTGSFGSVLDGRRANNAGIGEDIRLVGAGRGEFRHNGALITGLEPVPRVGRDGELLAGTKDDFVPDRVELAAPFGGLRSRIRSPRPRCVEVDFSRAAAERFLFARTAIDGGMPVLREGLAG